ncbi:MAG: 23S rRNA pseudouridine(1911/1915/1917) synthase RluD [Gammaproteobacteria bacterium]
MDTTRLEATIPAGPDGTRLDQALAAMFPDYSRSRLKEWILAGRVAIEGGNAVPRARVRSGQRIVVNATPEVREEARPQPIRLDVVHEDEHLLLIDKPAGLVVHPGAGNPEGTLLNGLLHYAPQLATLPRCGILHRLDKDTTGLLLVAKSPVAHTRLVQDLQERRIVREYRAVCSGRLTAGGRIDAPIGRHPTHRTRMAVIDRGRESVTHYRVLVRFAAHTLCAVRIESGRTHQIRVHFAHLRHPLVGDPVYGGRLRRPAGASERLVAALGGLGRQALHASRIGFRHPVSEEDLRFRAPLPGDLAGLLQALAEDAKDGAADLAWDDLTWPAADPS